MDLLSKVFLEWELLAFHQKYLLSVKVSSQLLSEKLVARKLYEVS